MILTAIDLGTNTIRIMTAEIISDSQIRVLYKDRKVVRLGKGFAEEKKILPESLERAVHIINTFSTRARKLQTEKILLYGTSALREATNSEKVRQFLNKETGLILQTISGETEAKLTSYGALQTLGITSKDVAVIDIGGGSSEFSLFPAKGTPAFLSIPVGAVWLTEKFLPHDPPKKEKYEEMYQFGYDSIKKILSSYSYSPLRHIIGTGGTATTLAAIQQKLSVYDPVKINNAIVSLVGIVELENHLRSLPIQERRKISGLEKGREDIILAGIALFIAFMKVLKISHITISDAGLLEGIIFQEIKPSGF